MSLIQLGAHDFQITQSTVVVSNSKTKNKPGMLLIWAKWCGHCHSFMPTYEKLAAKVGDKFPCTAVEHAVLEQNEGLSRGLEYQYFPTIKFFDQHGKITTTYPSNGGRDMKSLLDYICKMYHHCITQH